MGLLLSSSEELVVKCWFLTIVCVCLLRGLFLAVGYKMLADTAQFTGVNEKCLNLEMAEKKKAVEKMIDGSRWRQACEKRKVRTHNNFACACNSRSPPFIRFSFFPHCNCRDGCSRLS